MAHGLVKQFLVQLHDKARWIDPSLWFRVSIFVLTTNVDEPP